MTGVAGHDGHMSRIGEALMRTARDPVEFEALVSTIMDAGRGEDPSLPGLESLVRDLLPAPDLRADARLRGDLAEELRLLPTPAIAISTAGMVVAINELASARYDIAADTGLEAIGVDRRALARFLDRLARTPAAGSLLVADVEEERGTAMLWGRMLPRFGVICLFPVDTLWPVEVAEVLASEFGLSDREITVLRALAAGQSIEAIALADGRTVGTIRQTVKAVLGKLGVGSQARAVAFAATLAMAFLRADRLGGAVDPTVEGVGQSGLHDRWGRRIGLRHYGDAAGMPVLLVHGSLYGIGTLGAEQAMARAMGLRVLACERPGYGATPTCRVRNDPVQTAVEDMLLALDSAEVGQAVLLAHDTGFVHATELAARAPERVAGIVGVSPVVPMRSAEQSFDMPVQQQVFAWAVRRAPWLVDVLTRIGIQRMHRLGPQGWPHAIFAGVETDIAVAARPEALAALSSAFGFNTAQAAEGFRLDVTVANSDFSVTLAAVNCPVRLLHGARNRTVPLGAVQAVAEGRAGLEVQVVEDAGHTLALDRPELGLRQAFALALEARARAA